jgi:hypothetical protein
MQLSTHLQFNGQCEAAFRFYEKCLGGKITFLMTYGDSPMAQEAPPDWQRKIVHTSFALGEQTLSGADSWEEHHHAPQRILRGARNKGSRGGRPRLRGAGGERHDTNGDSGDVLGAAIRHARRPVRHPVDGQLQQARLINNCEFRIFQRGRRIPNRRGRQCRRV